MQTYYCYVITLPQLLLLVSHINPYKSTLLHMGYNKCSSYFEGRKSTPGNFSSWHSLWTPANSSSHIGQYLYDGFCCVLNLCPELQSKNQYISINIRNIILLSDFIDSFKNSKINLFKAPFGQFPFKEIKNSYKILHKQWQKNIHLQHKS